MIDRQKLVNRHNPVLTEVDVVSPLSVGNGNFAFTADVTGLQTLYDDYRDAVPLCTMAQWGWHTKPADTASGVHTLSDVEMTEYPYCGRTVHYAVEKKKGNEEIYDWVRQNPHKFNLASIGLVFHGEKLKSEALSNIRQELHLYEGMLESQFCINGMACHVQTAVDGESDTLAFALDSECFQQGFALELAFPYAATDISGSDWNAEHLHETTVLGEITDGVCSKVVMQRKLDKDVYMLALMLEGCVLEQAGKHRFLLKPNSSKLRVSMSFGTCLEESVYKALGSEACAHSDEVLKMAQKRERETQSSATWMERHTARFVDCEKVFSGSRTYWEKFWKKGAAIDVHESSDPRAMEFERRIVLSQYLLAIQSAGDMPPQETGLTCNSWYGKAHLEMYPWHEAWLPLWNHTDLLERSLDWYLVHLPEAEENAARNGFNGARWPKMIAEEGIDCPSKIATLLIWQQPHIIYMLEMAYQNILEMGKNGTSEKELFEASPKAHAFLEKYLPLVEKTAEFMVDYAVYNPMRGVYELLAPVIPVQENHKPMDTKNPTFELEYWKLTLEIAASWEERLGHTAPKEWREVAENMAPSAVGDGRYLAHEACPDTYEHFAYDHPSMLCAYGLIDSGRMDRETMEHSLEKVEQCWEYPRLWGWDFAVMAMTAVRLGRPSYAIDLLLMDSPKNRYVKSGNNFQEGRKDLPLYLPGNGSLLLAAALMAGGWKGSGKTPGFPKDGSWIVACEGIQAFPC